MASSSSSSNTEGQAEILVKTLDGKNRRFTVSDSLTVRQFKENISSEIEVPADTQRLIFQGRVMQDEKVLKDYDVHGKAIHLVKRAPPSSISGATPSSATPSASSNSQRPQGAPPGRPHGHVIHLGRVPPQLPSSREAKARLRQAEFNLGIINDALHLLEDRTGVSIEDLPGPDEAELRLDTEMDTSTSSNGQSGQASDTAAGAANTDGGGTSSDPTDAQQEGQPTGATSGTDGNRAQENNLTATELADFLDRVLRTNNRIVPHLRRYRNYLRTEEDYPQDSRGRRDAQETVNRVNEALHAMSHVMHSISDVMVDMSTLQPRQGLAHARPPFSLPTGATSMSIPIHMNIRPRGNNGNQPQQQQQGSQTSAASTTTTTTTGGPTPTASSGGSNPQPPPTANGVLGGDGATTTATLGPFHIPLGTIPLPGVGNGNSASVIVEAMANFDAVIGSDSGGSSEDSNDSSTTAESSVTVEASSSPETRTNTSAAAGTAPQQASGPNNTTISGQFGNIPGSTSSFTFGPTTNVNVLPNVPGMPPGVLQNIIGSLLSQQGVGPNQQVQVNVIRQQVPVQVGPQWSTGGGPAGPGGPPQQMDLPVDTHLEQHFQLHRTAVNNATASRSDASQQASPSTTEMGTGTSNNAATNTATRSERATNTAAASSSSTAATNTENTGRSAASNTAAAASRSSTAATNTENTGRSAASNTAAATSSSSTASTNTDNTGVSTASVGVGAGVSSANVGTATPPGMGTSNRSTNPLPPRFQPPLNLGYTDPFLQCNSHNYHTQSTRAAFRALQQQSRARERQAGPQQQQVPNLSTMVSGMVGNIIEQVGQAFTNGYRSAANGTPTNGATTSSTNTTGTSARTTSSAGSSTAPSSTGTTTNGGRASSTQQSQQPPPPPFIPMQMFSGMFGGAAPSGGVQMPINIEAVVGNLMQAARNTPGTGSNSTNQPSGPPGGTLADMFTYFRPQGETQDEGESSNVLVSLLEAVAPHMGLADLFSLVMGNSRVVGQLRAPLRTYVTQRLARVDNSIETLVRTALDDMQPEIQHIQGLVQVRPGVDLTMSVRNCLKTHLTSLFTAINSTTPANDEEFGSNLYSLWMKMMAELIALNIYCIRDGQAGFSNMVHSYMPRMTQGLNPALTIWMTTSLQSILLSFHRNHPVEESQIIGFVVHTDPNRQAGSSGTAADGVASTATTPANESSNTSAIQPMEVGGESPVQPPKAKAARTVPDEEGEIFVDALESVTPSQQPQQCAATTTTRPSTINTPTVTPTTTTPTSDTRRSTRLVDTRGDNRGQNRRAAPANDNWQAVIPQEWIPVINQDVARQQEQRQQPPLSDAYLQGLPAKRRRMMHNMEHAGEMGSMARYLPSALTRAARAAGVEPISSDENMLREAADDLDLQAELEREVTAVLESRVTSDSDYSSERFPNAREYFHKSKRH